MQEIIATPEQINRAADIIAGMSGHQSGFCVFGVNGLDGGAWYSDGSWPDLTDAVTIRVPGRTIARHDARRIVEQAIRTYGHPRITVEEATRDHPLEDIGAIAEEAEVCGHGPAVIQDTAGNSFRICGPAGSILTGLEAGEEIRRTERVLQEMMWERN